jgi:uncharacterized protein with von Willebrand factor type A (vWA) domain
MLAFGRELRDAGLPVGSGQVMSLVEATSVCDCRRRDDFYHAARSTLVTSPEQIPVFDAEFSRFWRRLARAGVLDEDLFPENTSDSNSMPDIPAPPNQRGAREAKTLQNESVGKKRTLLAIEEANEDDVGETEEHEAPPEDVLVFSAREVLRKKDFAQLSPQEIAEARRIIEGMSWQLGKR